MGSETPSSLPLSSSQKELLREFLQGAPTELSEWAAGQQKLLDLGEVQGEATLAGATGEQEVPTESDDFYDDMEGEDDVLQRRPRVTAGTKSAPRTGLAGGGAKIALVVALILGGSFGLWYAGRDTTQGVDAGTPTMTTGTAENADPLRQIELEAQVQQDPEDLDARLELGILYFNQGQVTLATEQWEAVTELDPQNITAWYNLGFARLSEDPPDMEAAQEAWQKVLDIDPESELAETISMHMGGVGIDSEESGN